MLMIRSTLFTLIAFLAQVLTATADDYFLCEPRDLKIQSPLVVKYSAGVATEILFVYKQNDRPDSYRVTERNDIYYLADEVSPEAPDAFASLKINRLSGELQFIHRIPMEAVQLLKNVCDKKIPVTECDNRMIRIRGGSWMLCSYSRETMTLIDDASCAKWRSGDNIAGHYILQCQRTERRF